MTNPTRPNFFILLGLDPRAPWDPVRYDVALAQKRREWSVQIGGVGRTALEANRNLGLLPQIRAVMLNDARRSAEAQDAILEFEQMRQAARQRFEELLRIAEAKGYINDAEIVAWAQDFSDVMTEAEIRRRVTVAIRSTAGPARPKVEPLDPTLARVISERLEILHLADLYALLGMSRSTDTRRLHAAATALYGQMQGHAYKTSEVTAKSELAGHAMVVFETDEMRRRYDETLRRASLELLVKKYEPAFRGAGEINEKQAALFLQEARAAGWSVKEATERLDTLARQRRWAFTAPGDATIMGARAQRIFVSHSHADSEWCDRFVDGLARGGLDVWYDKQGLYVGMQWVQAIEHELQACDLFLVVLTPDAWASHWVQKELALALASHKAIVGVFHKPTPVTGFLTTYQLLDVAGQDPAAAAQRALRVIGVHAH